MPANFAADLDQLTELKDIIDYIRARHAEINACVPPADYGRGMLAANTQLVDDTIRRLFRLSCDRVPEFQAAPPEICVVATGGYGRGELAPCSDVDITFIPAREEDDALNVLIKHMFQQVMDVFLYGADMKVGYAYRLFDDLSQLDHHTQTALLDARLIVGDVSLFESFQTAYRENLLVLHFMFQKQAERDEVLARKGGDVVYIVEPDIKEGAGGLRDAQIVEWFAEALFETSRDDAVAALVSQGILPEHESIEFRDAYNFLLTVRNALHCITKEARDVLTTEKQEVVASLLRYTDHDRKPGLEWFMADVYTRLAIVRRTARKVIGRCLDSPLDLGVGGLVSVEHKIVIADPQEAERDPAMPFHACELAQAYGLAYGDRYQEDLDAYILANAESPNIDICGRVFTRILQSSRGVSHSVRVLVDQNILNWLIPEFTPLRTLIPYDAAHEFTVGEHSLKVVEFLDSLRYSNDHRYTEYARAWTEVVYPEVLYLAGLIHDMGKQWPDTGDHADSGAVSAEKIGARLGWDTERITKLVFLVRHHLLMAETSRLRDLRLEETIREFTRIVNDHDLLNMLYILTCADTNGVGERVWTEMKAKFLAELYARAQTAITAMTQGGASEEEVFSYVPDLAKHRERIKTQLGRHNLPQDAIHEHTVRMPAQYLLNTPLEEMYLHIAMINRLRSTGLPTVDFKTDVGADYTEMTIVAVDDPSPGLLSKIVGVLYALDLNIHGSQVFTRESSASIALDTLWIDYRGRPLSTSKRAEVQETLRNVLTGKLNLDALFEKRKKAAKQQVIHRATLDEQTSERYSLLEVRAPDEPGVLYRLSAALSKLKWNIHSARVSVWGSRVRAAFYMTDATGQKIPESEIERLLALLPREEFRRRRIVTPAEV